MSKKSGKVVITKKSLLDTRTPSPAKPVNTGQSGEQDFFWAFPSRELNTREDLQKSFCKIIEGMRGHDFEVAHPSRVGGNYYVKVRCYVGSGCEFCNKLVSFLVKF